MAVWFCCRWIYVWMVTLVLREISADTNQTAHYRVHHHQFSFDDALTECSPGVLTTLTTQTEVSKILHHISRSMSSQSPHNFTYWVGLRKVKDQCVVPSLNLRGFTWIEDSSQELDKIPWAEEPEETCVTVRCAAMTGEFDGTTVTRWGLIPVQCKTKYRFICKQSQKPKPIVPPAPKPSDPVAPEIAKPAAPETVTPEPAAPKPPVTATPKQEPAKPSTPADITPATQDPPHPSLSPTQEPESKSGTGKPGPESELPPTSETEAKLTPDTQPGLHGPDPGLDPVPGKASCDQNFFSVFRSVQFSDGGVQVQVECWSSDLVKLRCEGRPILWRLLDGSPANLSAICHPCEAGFQKDSLGQCADVDECHNGGSTSCRHLCVNTQGSFRCVCADETGKEHPEDSMVCRNMTAKVDDGLLSGILIPVLIAVAAFVVLVLVVVVMVKCCLMRRSKKRAIKKAEKMALKSKEDKDSFQTANEKAAT